MAHRRRFPHAAMIVAALVATLLAPRAAAAASRTAAPALEQAAVGRPGPLEPQAANVGFQAVTPARLLDTRPGGPTTDGSFSGVDALGPNGQIDLQVLGRGGVPVTGIDAVVLNVTAVDPTERGFLTVWPTGQARPHASSLNFAPGKNVPNLVFAKVSLGGRVSIFNFAGATHVVVDVVGFANSNGVRSLVPARVLDTRPDGITADGTQARAGALGPGAVYDLPLLNRVGVPATSVDSVVLNVTVDDPTEHGYLTVWPSGADRPTASNLNFTPGLTVANLVVAKVGNDGIVRLFNSHGATQVVVDVVGYFPGTAAFESVVPARVLDTRAGQPTVDGVGAGVGALDAGEDGSLAVTGRGGVPETGVGAVIVNVTATNPTEKGFLTVWPDDEVRPTASNLNFEPGQTVPNLVLARVSDDGRIAIFNSAGHTDVIVDVVGFVPETDELFHSVYELPPAVFGAPYTHAIDTRGGDAPYLWSASALQPGLSLSQTTGTITGTPTSVGTVNLTLRAQDAFGRIDERDVGHTVFPADSGYTPITPATVLNRMNIGASVVTDVVVAGVGDVPANATTVVLTVTVASSGTGALGISPAGGPLPLYSSLIFAPGVETNLVVVPVGAGGAIRMSSGQPLAGALVDVVGYFGPSSNYTAAGIQVMNTSSAGSAPTPGSPRTANLPPDRPSGATAAIVLITTFSRSGPGTLRAWSGPSTPANPMMQWHEGAGATLRTAVVPLADGTITVEPQSASTHVIVNVVGYLTATGG